MIHNTLKPIEAFLLFTIYQNYTLALKAARLNNSGSKIILIFSSLFVSDGTSNLLFSACNFGKILDFDCL